MKPTASFRLWFQVDGKPVIGEGRVELLLAIGECGSLAEGGQQVGISYRRAHNLISVLNRRCGIKIVETRVGGPGGGGTRLTRDGLRLVQDYVSLRNELEDRVRAFDKDRDKR